MTTRITLLGPVAVHVRDRPVNAGPPLRRAVLAVLALHVGEVVSRDEVIALVWGAAPPRSAAGNVQTYVSALRAVLDPPGALTLVDGGYRLDLPRDAVDVHRVGAAARAADDLLAGGRPDLAARAFEEALAHWTAEPLAGVPGPFAEARRAALVERRLDILEGWARAALALGRTEDVAEALLPVLVDHPHREALVDLVARARATDEPVTPRTVPAQLPPGVPSFVGRGGQLARMREVLDAAGTAPRLVLLHGAGGAGKTGLAVHFGTGVASRFPDGVLFLDLRGFGPEREPMTATDALGVLLRALGTPHDRVPAQHDGRVAAFRDLTADKRLLLVLDNAASTRQVRPLVPGGNGCFTVVTSRRYLAGLIARDGAAAVHVGELTEDESLDLLGAAIGTERVEAECDAARALVRACGLLPLTVRIAAERVATRTARSLTDVVDELAVLEERLDLLAVDDEAAATRTVLSWSYRALDPVTARCFRLLGGSVGPDFAGPAAAALVGAPPPEAERVLRVLVDCHLLERRPGGRYQFHDLVRLYAGELFAAEPAEARDAARHRLFDWHLHGTSAVDALVAPHRYQFAVVPPPSPEVTTPSFETAAEAYRWSEEELDTTTAVVSAAAAAGFDRHAWLTAHFFAHFCYQRGHGRQWEEVLTVAVEACQRLGDVFAEIVCRYNLNGAYQHQGRYREALDACRLIIDKGRESPEYKPVLHYASTSAAMSLVELNRPAEAVEMLKSVIDDPEFAAAPQRLEIALVMLGEACRALGRYTEAMEHQRRVLADRLDRGDVDGQMRSFRALGKLHAEIGDHEEAIACYERSLGLARDTANRHARGEALLGLGRVHSAALRHDRARTCLLAAQELFEQVGSARADEARVALAELPDERAAWSDDPGAHGVGHGV
ncbi:tetratricopeptide repeat protein [Saccharothrix sp. Mg75]|uniref:AfsR/SARP family transcriptional regulator n=1 Tax=Saccharothrix sp. Mg75 TaxID=3445357 RepID=UPI003EF073B5